VNWSAALVVLVPPGVVTVMSTVPGVPVGEIAVIEVGLLTVKLAEVLAKLTAVAPVKFVPVTVTEAPPVAIPEVGLTADTVGGGGTVYVYLSTALVALVPPGVVTVTSTVDRAPGGEVAVMVLALFTVNVAGLPDPKSTAVAPVKLVPVIVTDVSPVLCPEVGLRFVTAGGGGVV